MMLKKLSELNKNQLVRIVEIKADETTIKRLSNLGLLVGSEIKLKGKFAFKGPIALSIHGAKIAIRHSDAEKILVQKTEQETKQETEQKIEE